MATKIQWTDDSWNPILGCQAVSPGCANCYAARLSATRLAHLPQYEGLATLNESGRGVWMGKVHLLEERLVEPLKWKKPRRVFVCDMSDLFYEKVPDEFIDRVFAIMALCPHLTFQVLTKRALRMRDYLASDDLDHRIGAAAGCMLDGDWIWNEGKKWRPRIEKVIDRAHGLICEGGDYVTDYRSPPFLPLPNVWCGVSTENQETADERIPLLLQCPAAVRFLSVEPLLGPVDLHLTECGGHDRDETGWRERHWLLHWVIIGGESGPHARPCNPSWVKELVNQCRAAGVACFVKQLGSNVLDFSGRLRDPKGGNPEEWPEDLRTREFPR